MPVALDTAVIRHLPLCEQPSGLHPAELDSSGSILEANAHAKRPAVHDFCGNLVNMVRSYLRPIRPDHLLSGAKRKHCLLLSRSYGACLNECSVLGPLTMCLQAARLPDLAWLCAFSCSLAESTCRAGSNIYATRVAARYQPRELCPSNIAVVEVEISNGRWEPEGYDQVLTRTRNAPTERLTAKLFQSWPKPAYFEEVQVCRRGRSINNGAEQLQPAFDVARPQTVGASAVLFTHPHSGIRCEDVLSGRTIGSQLWSRRYSSPSL